MSDQTIPPCPVCGTVPIMSIYQSENRIDGCKCIQWPIPCTQEYWGLWCDEAIGRHTRANLGITTIAQLNDRLAPDPRVVVLEKKLAKLTYKLEMVEQESEQRLSAIIGYSDQLLAMKEKYEPETPQVG